MPAPSHGFHLIRRRRLAGYPVICLYRIGTLGDSPLLQHLHPHHIVFMPTSPLINLTSFPSVIHPRQIAYKVIIKKMMVGKSRRSSYQSIHMPISIYYAIPRKSNNHTTVAFKYFKKIFKMRLLPQVIAVQECDIVPLRTSYTKVPWDIRKPQGVIVNQQLDTGVLLTDCLNDNALLPLFLTHLVLNNN